MLFDRTQELLRRSRIDPQVHRPRSQRPPSSFRRGSCRCRECHPAPYRSPSFRPAWSPASDRIGFKIAIPAFIAFGGQQDFRHEEGAIAEVDADDRHPCDQGFVQHLGRGPAAVEQDAAYLRRISSPRPSYMSSCICLTSSSSEGSARTISSSNRQSHRSPLFSSLCVIRARAARLIARRTFDDPRQLLPSAHCRASCPLVRAGWETSRGSPGPHFGSMYFGVVAREDRLHLLMRQLVYVSSPPLASQSLAVRRSPTSG